MQSQDFLTSLTDELYLRRFFLIKIVALLAAFVLCCALDAPAQTKRKKDRPKTASKTIAASSNKQNLPMIQTPQAVTIINRAETDFLSGEASIAVNPKQPTVVRLGLAQNAVSIVEFPASDGIYYIHEGNPKFASVFQSPTKETDRSITIYPGEGFVAARDGNGGATPSATITLQMRSGLVLILELVPVSDLRKNAHRCVINYNRDEVVAARRTAGLAYNLGDDINPNNPRGSTRASSKLVGGVTSDETTNGVKDNIESPNIVQTSLEVFKGSISRKLDADKSSKKPKTALELSRFVNRRLADCL